jgi:hypothetical protein
MIHRKTAFPEEFPLHLWKKHDTILLGASLDNGTLLPGTSDALFRSEGARFAFSLTHARAHTGDQQ